MTGSERTKAWREKNPEKFAAYRVANKDRFRAYSKEYRTNHPEKRRTRDWLRLYGLSSADYERLLTKQGGLCGMCATVPVQNEVLSVDHDHVTGKVRGLLHKKCNTALGLLGDDPIKSASKLARYACVMERT